MAFDCHGLLPCVAVSAGLTSNPVSLLMPLSQYEPLCDLSMLLHSSS